LKLPKLVLDAFNVLLDGINKNDDQGLRNAMNEAVKE